MCMRYKQPPRTRIYKSYKYFWVRIDQVLICGTGVKMLHKSNWWCLLLKYKFPKMFSGCWCARLHISLFFFFFLFVPHTSFCYSCRICCLQAFVPTERPHVPITHPVNLSETDSSWTAKHVWNDGKFINDIFTDFTFWINKRINIMQIVKQIDPPVWFKKKRKTAVLSHS